MLRIRATSDHDKEAHRSSVSGEIWNNMIVYEMGSSPTTISTTPKTSPMHNFKHGCKNDMATNVPTPFTLQKFLGDQVSSDNLKPSYIKLGLQQTPTWDLILILILF